MSEAKKLENTEDYDDKALRLSAVQVVEMDTGITATFRGYRENPQKSIVFMIMSFLTLGLTYAASIWSLPLRVLWTMDRCSLAEAEWIFATNDEDSEDLRKVEHDSRTGNKFFLYRYVRFNFDNTKGKYGIVDVVEMIRSDIPSQGLSDSVVAERRSQIGDNSFEIENKPWYLILVDGILHPFNVFQLFASVIWYFQDQASYAFMIMLMTIVGITTALLETMKSHRHLREMAYFSCPVNVYRDGKWICGQSSEVLVPGDIFELDCDMEILPCDAILINGEVLLNESMLTGESIPVVRKSIPADEPLIDNLDNKASILYAGTRLMRVRGGSSRRAVAMAVRTGFDTFKGFLIRQIIYPPPLKFKFYEDSIKYVLFLVCLSFGGIIYTLYCLIIRFPEAWLSVFLGCCDLVTVVVPPALPAVLVVGTNITIQRLKRRKISTTFPAKLNICGRLDIFCFDKTGTLTEEGLDICAVVGTKTASSDECRECSSDYESSEEDSEDGDRNQNTTTSTAAKLPVIEDSDDSVSDLVEGENRRVFSDPVTDPMDLSDKFFHLLSCCHTVTVVHGRLVGDPLDLKMFEFTGCVLEEPDHSPDDQNLAGTTIRPFEGSGNELKIIRSFPFDATLKRQSVLIKDVVEDDFEFYTKGAPEVIKEHCRPETLPEDFDDLLGYYARHGQRVVACAYRRVPEEVEELMRMPRGQIEKDLAFLGFIVFENKLKEESPVAISELAAANIRSIMVTGDNVLTAVNVARKCGIVDEDCKVFFPVSDVVGPKGEVKFVNVEDASEWLTDLPSFLLHHKPRFGKVPNVQVALTGRVFSQLKELYSWPLFSALLSRCNIYSRMSPLEKHELVEELQELEHCVAMVGDGANDCGALRVADVGVSLSDSEASLAAPFCSGVPTIACAPLLVREGRAALATSFSSFKYMTLYSAIQFTTVCLLRWYSQPMLASQFICMDMITVLLLASTLTCAGPKGRIDPIRPTASLLSASVLVSILSQCAVQIGFQALVRLTIEPMAPFDAETVAEGEKFFGRAIRQILIPFSGYQYIWSAMIYAVGGKYRESMFTNSKFMASCVFLFTLHTVLLFGCFEGFIYKYFTNDSYVRETYDGYFDLGAPSTDKAVKIFGFALLNLLVCAAVEYTVAPVIIRLCELLKRKRPTAREELEAISIDDLEKSDLPVRKNLNKKPILKKL